MPRKSEKANSADIIDPNKKLIIITPAVFGETVPQTMSEIDIKFIGDFCSTDKEKAEWFISHCMTADNKTKKFTAFRREFCEAFYPDLLPKKMVKKNTKYFLEQLKEKYNI